MMRHRAMRWLDRVPPGPAGIMVFTQPTKNFHLNHPFSQLKVRAIRPI